MKIIGSTLLFFLFVYVVSRRELDRHHPHEKYHISVLYNQNLTTKTWADLGRENWEYAPPGRGGATIWKLYNNLYIFGGKEYNSIQYNDLWRFNLDNLMWTWLKGYGGKNGPKVCRDQWRTCRQFEHDNTPSARFYAAGFALPRSYEKDEGEGALYLLGGEATYLDKYIVYNDVWEFSLERMSWRCIFEDTATTESDKSHYGDVLNRMYSNNIFPHRFTGASFFANRDHYGAGKALGYVSKVHVDGQVHAVNEIWRVFRNQYEKASFKFEWGWQDVFDNISCNYKSYHREGIGCPPARFYPHVWQTQIEMNQTYLWVFGGFFPYHSTFVWEYQDLWRWKGSWNYISGPKFAGVGEKMNYIYRYNESNFPGGHIHGGVWAVEAPELEKVYLHIFGGVGPKNQGSLDVWTFWYDLGSDVKRHFDKKYHRAITWKKSYIAERMNVSRYLPAVVGGKLPWPRYEWAGYIFGGLTAEGKGLSDLAAYTRWDIECYGINWDDTRDVCGGNRGECVANDLCLCDYGFYGVKCDYEKTIPDSFTFATLGTIAFVQASILLTILIVSFLVYFVGIKKYKVTTKLIFTLGVLEFISSDETRRKGPIYEKDFDRVKKKYREKYKEETGIRIILKELEAEKVSERDEERKERKRKSMKRKRLRLQRKKNKKKKKNNSGSNSKKKRFGLLPSLGRRSRPSKRRRRRTKK